MIICIICLGIESSNKKDDEDVELEDGEVESGRSKVVSCFLAILLGLVSAVLMSSKHILIRFFKGGYSAFD